MTEGFRFIYLAFGFSEAENLPTPCMGYLGASMSAGVHTRAKLDIAFRDVTIKIQDRGYDQECE